MQPESKESTELRQLLALKRHEVPPPGFFDRLPERIRAEILTGPRDSAPPWWARFSAGRAWRPALAGMCALGAVGLVVWRAGETQPRQHGLIPILALEHSGVVMGFPSRLEPAPSVSLSAYPIEAEGTSEQPSVSPFLSRPSTASPPPEGLFRPQLRAVILKASGPPSLTNILAR